MKALKIAVTAALLSGAVVAHAQAYSVNPSTGQRYDQYGRPVASDKELCREAQMAGGPVTARCMSQGFEFNQQGELLVIYHFEKWGYPMVSKLPEKLAKRLDSDAAFRQQYIKTQVIPVINSVRAGQSSAPSASSAAPGEVPVNAPGRPPITHANVAATYHVAGVPESYLILTNIECPDAKLNERATFGSGKSYLAVSRAWLGQGEDKGEVVGCFFRMAKGALTQGPTINILWRGYPDSDMDSDDVAMFSWTPVGSTLRRQLARD